MVPPGASLFLRSWRFVASARDPRSAVSAYRAGGLRWGMPVVSRPASDGRIITKLREADYWRAFSDARIPLWGCWLLPYPSSTLALDACRFCEDMARLGARGCVIDPELRFKGQPDAAAELSGAMRENTRRLGLGYAVTSYSVASGHPTFPWREFSDCDSGIAQTYDRDNAFEAGYVARALDSWRAEGFRDVIPCRGLNDHARNATKTAADLRRHFELLPNPRSCGVWGPVRIPSHAWAELTRWATGINPDAPSGAGNGGGSGAKLAAIAGGLLLAGGVAVALAGSK